MTLGEYIDIIYCVHLKILQRIMILDGEVESGDEIRISRNQQGDYPYIWDTQVQKNVDEIMSNSSTLWHRDEFFKLKGLSREVRFFMNPKTMKLSHLSNNLEKVLWYWIEEIWFLDNLIFEWDREKVLKLMQENTNSLVKKSEFVLEYRMYKKDGTTITVEQKTIAKYDKKWKLVELYGYITDISEEKRLIYTDDETGLYNQKKLKKDIEENTIPKILSIFKLHWFWELNSMYTYDKWNEIRDSLIQKFIEFSKEYDFELYNFWELKFGMMMNHIHSDEEATIRIENIYNAMQKALNWYPIYISLWYVFSDELSINKASIALEETKKQPWIQMYTKELADKNHDEAENREKWRSRVEHQIENFTPFYQKIKSNYPWVKDKYEALVRYVDENWEVISPYFFLKIIKNARLIQKLTRRMVEQILVDMQGNNHDVSINLTTEDLTSETFIKELITKIKAGNIDFSRITVEILEDMHDDEETVTAILKTCTILKQKGIKIAIDDYGTGFSNIERILTINPDLIKIDGSLIKWLERDDEEGKKKMKIVSMLINNFQNATTGIVFEFVENKEIQEIAQRLWVNYSQGYYHSKPTRKFD